MICIAWAFINRWTQTSFGDLWNYSTESFATIANRMPSRAICKLANFV
jgi:hypothetical protein